jgi:hypothetical protein
MAERAAERRRSDAATADGTTADAVTVTEGAVEVSLAPSEVGIRERLAAANDRVARLERTIDGVTTRIGRVVAERRKTAGATSADAPWRAFLDLQRLVADRLDRRERR